MRAHDLIFAGLNSDQAAAVLDFAAEVALTRGGAFRLDGEPFRLQDGAGLEVYLRNDAGRTAIAHVAPSGQLVEV